MPTLVIDDFVQAREDLPADDDGVVPAVQGDVGRVTYVDYTGPFVTATVSWERTGRLFDVLMSEIDVLAEPGFAATEATTPKRPRTTYVRRGME